MESKSALLSLSKQAIVSIRNANVLSENELISKSKEGLRYKKFTNYKSKDINQKIQLSSLDKDNFVSLFHSNANDSLFVNYDRILFFNNDLDIAKGKIKCKSRSIFRNKKIKEYIFTGNGLVGLTHLGQVKTITVSPNEIQRIDARCLIAYKSNHYVSGRFSKMNFFKLLFSDDAKCYIYFAGPATIYVDTTQAKRG